MIKFNASALATGLAILAAAPAGAATVADTMSAVYDNDAPSNIFTLNNACGCDPTWSSVAIQQVTLNAKTRLTGIDAALIALNQNDPAFDGIAPHFGGFDKTSGYQVNIYSSIAAAEVNLTGDVYSLTVAGNAPTFGAALTIDDPNGYILPYSPGSTTASIAIDKVLASGTYYIGVTALTDPDVDGQESIFVAGGTGSGGTLANPGGSWGTYFGPGNSWDVGSKLGYRLEGLQGVAGVPEPASWALLIAGFGFAGASVRRRRASLTVSHA
jgi:hypothetical protein